MTKKINCMKVNINKHIVKFACNIIRNKHLCFSFNIVKIANDELILLSNKHNL